MQNTVSWIAKNCHRLFRIACAVMAFAVPAHAELSLAVPAHLMCRTPIAGIGNTYSTNPVVRIKVDYDPKWHTWQVFDILKHGEMVDRSKHFTMLDRTTSKTASWYGYNPDNHARMMVGEVILDEEGIIWYAEIQYIKEKMFMQTRALCKKQLAAQTCKTHCSIQRDTRICTSYCWKPHE